jgi:hypothetical protein
MSTETEPFPDLIESRVIEYAPGSFAPVVSRDGKWEFKGGRVYRSHEDASAAAVDEVNEAKKFWAMQLQNRSNAVVVGGVHYRLGSRGANVRADLRGSSGRTFHLRNLETGEMVTCSDLWFQGVIPDFARPAFADTHEFTSPGERDE